MKKIFVGIVGLGKIAIDQHIPNIQQSKEFTLVAAATKQGSLEGLPTFATLESMLDAHPEIDAISLCVPPEPRYDLARTVLAAGKHVLLEKPPATSVAAAQNLVRMAADRGLSLFTAWHSKYAAGVEKARSHLKDKSIRSVKVFWKEDVRVWHPNQEWIWLPGNLGVFDPGINALSILTEILPHSLYVKDAVLDFPSNRDTPIAAAVTFGSDGNYDVLVELDWMESGPPKWEIEIVTEHGACALTKGGACLKIDGRMIDLPESSEYDAVYRKFASLIEQRESYADLTPFQHAADAFMLGKRKIVAPFFWSNK